MSEICCRVVPNKGGAEYVACGLTLGDTIDKIATFIYKECKGYDKKPEEFYVVYEDEYGDVLPEDELMDIWDVAHLMIEEG